ncbi:NADP-dependent oxidoreductase [Tunturibacter empetritectus]|uniref:NADPH:quinone reductase-like Zn-dependent oxidoreductase n=1 Tax=Tunturiibacter empetritectus TaxID=3069691 RepID=A0A7W8IK05_9BACT|nr:NADP-dependent oxidoreductase [Edaphobacter lichenicola]MBB5318502.1 NADPH:quinone reductase-like Zn-dependent oxidoreductase [Edaphobacter lichenicola]
MRAVVLHEYGGPDKLKYEVVPDPVAGRGEVLVRVAAASVNPIDYKMRSGEMKKYLPLELPAILGRDLSGIVREVGQGVSGFAPGDKVMATATKTYAELVVVKATDLALIPEKLDLVHAAALPVVALAGEQLISRGTKIQTGQTVLVAGAVGGVGRSAVWTAKKAGAIVFAGVRKSQLKEAESLKADHVIALDDAAAMDKLGFIDAVADAVGGETANQLLAKVKQGGVFASVLGPPSDAKLHPTVRVEMIRSEPDAKTLRTLAEDVVAGRFSIPIDRMVPLEEAGQAQAAAAKGGIGKILLLA